MSDTCASLRQRIQSATDLKSVVRTMKSLAASRIGQYERSVRALADYYRTVEIGLGACLRAGGPIAPVLAAKRPARSAEVGAVVFGSDQGLVGQFNEIVVALADRTLPRPPARVRVRAVGQRVHARLVAAGRAPSAVFDVPGSVETIGRLVGQVLLAIEPAEDAIPELYLFYNRSTPSGTFAPVSERLLPLDDEWRRARASVAWPTSTRPEVTGAGDTTLRALVREYLFVSLFRAAAESLASENSSRLEAMDRAERNIKESLETLEGTFHRVRQGGIDEELSDIVSGFEALSKRGAPSATPAAPGAP